MRVLVAYDGSESADQAIDLVAGVAWPPASEVRIVTAHQLILPGEIVDAGLMEEIIEAEQGEAERLATRAHRRVERPGLVAVSEVTAGRPASVIHEAAERFGADLLVVGSRGLGPFTSALLGSVSEELVDHAPCPVLVARGLSLGRILLADDGSRDAGAAAALLTGWPILRDSQVRVVTVAETGGQAGSPAPATAGSGTMESAAPNARRLVGSGREVAEQIAQATADRLRGAGFVVDTEVRQGDPAEAIIAASHAWPADLIAIGSRGQTGLARLLRGSVARKVLLHAGCSVLIERER